jgi:hypothetical protein
VTASTLGVCIEVYYHDFPESSLIMGRWHGRPKYRKVLARPLEEHVETAGYASRADYVIAEHVWYRMNRVQPGNYWPELDQLKLRSMMTGDIVVIDGRAYLAAMVGFDPAERPHSEESA